MKKLSILLLAFGLLATSCEKELEIASEASLDATAPLSTADIDKLLTGAYKKVMEPSDYGFFNIMATEIMSDNLKPYKFQWIQVQYLYEHLTPADDILLTRFYKDYYNGIYRANTILKVPTATMAQKGKARYVRAISYLRLYDLYEGVPLVDENYDNKPIKASAPKDVLAFIIEDLKFAKANIEPLNLNNAVAKLTPTSDAASALLARVYRMNGDLAKAGIEAEELIKSGKYSISANPKNYDPEVILKFAGNRAEENGSWGWVLSSDTSTWNCFGVADDLVALASGTDTRKALFDAKDPKFNNFIFSNKYSRTDDSDLLVSRIPEMYLISAEAGNTARLGELQAVRKSSLSLDNERRLELSLEWVRWSDLKMKGEKYKLPFPQGAIDANDLLGK